MTTNQICKAIAVSKIPHRIFASTTIKSNIDRELDGIFEQVSLDSIVDEKLVRDLQIKLDEVVERIRALIDACYSEDRNNAQLTATQENKSCHPQLSLSISNFDVFAICAFFKEMTPDKVAITKSAEVNISKNAELDAAGRCPFINQRNGDGIENNCMIHEWRPLICRIERNCHGCKNANIDEREWNEWVNGTAEMAYFISEFYKRLLKGETEKLRNIEDIVKQVFSNKDLFKKWQSKPQCMA